jgi:hypothetical protein
VRPVIFSPPSTRRMERPIDEVVMLRTLSRRATRRCCLSAAPSPV